MRLSPKKLLAVFGVVLVCLFFGIKSRYFYPIVNRGSAGTAIVALGDSLTYGTGAGKGEDWPALVGSRVGRTIINKGVPGDTTADALARIDRDVLALNREVVIVGLGGNDMLNRLPEEQMFANIREIVKRVQDSGAMVVLLGLNGFPLDGGMGGTYKTIAREMGCVYVPNILGGILTNTKLKSDQIHPNAAGYRVMADKIFKGIEKYL